MKKNNKPVHIIRLPSLLTMFDAIKALENDSIVRKPSWALLSQEKDKILFESPEKLSLLEFAKANNLEVAATTINDVN